MDWTSFHSPTKLRRRGANIAVRLVWLRVAIFSSLLSLSIPLAHASPLVNTDEDLVAELNALRQAQEDLSKRIAALESRLGMTQKTPAVEEVLRLPNEAVAPSINASNTRFDFSGDLRLRTELNRSAGTLSERDRGTLRGRFQGSYRPNQDWQIFARLVTGAIEDPNSTDVTFGRFGDDITLGFDLLYGVREWGSAEIFLGQHPNVFQRTDMVWDGDVSLQGVAIDWPIMLGHNAHNLSARGAFAIIEENPIGDDSTLSALQLVSSNRFAPGIDMTSSIALFDYDLNALATADAGDFRTNLISEDGTYVSDFEIWDFNTSIRLSDQILWWPATFRLNIAKNEGAATRQDSAFLADLTLGDVTQGTPFELRYGYSEVDQEAVFTAVSNDNLAIASGYELHAINAILPLKNDIEFNTNFSVYRDIRQIDELLRLDQGEWQYRARFNLLFRF